MAKYQQKIWIHLLEVCFISNIFAGLGKLGKIDLILQVFLKFVVDHLNHKVKISW